jgi:hypothetical protein
VRGEGIRTDVRDESGMYCTLGWGRGEEMLGKMAWYVPLSNKDRQEIRVQYMMLGAHQPERRLGRHERE